METVSDLDCYVSNFWRATQHDPEGVVDHADGPVNECDLHARHRYLVLSDDASAFRERMRTDPDYYDCRIAGWWCWGLCCWIGSGWCDASQLDRVPADGRRPAIGNAHPTSTGGGREIHGQPQKRPLIAGDNPGSHGKGVHARGELSQQVPDLASGRTSRGGLAVHSVGNRPQLADTHSRGRGVHSNDSAGTCAERRAWLLDWFGRLRDRLRNVRVCCGDWSRVCSSESVTTRLGVTGVFLDPPYSAQAGRSMKLYSQESGTVAHDVRAWCLEHGSHPMMRICLAGYESEGHEVLLEHGWICHAWEAQGGYGNRSGKGRANRKRERLFFSPNCVNDGPLFAPRPEPSDE